MFWIMNSWEMSNKGKIFTLIYDDGVYDFGRFSGLANKLTRLTPG